MKITFAGTPIATGRLQGGTDAITGFLLERDADVQTAKYLRVKDAVYFGRGNRSRPLSGTITPAQFDDIGTAVQEMLLNFDDLPDSGVLVIAAGTKQTTFDNAVLQKVKCLYRRGVATSASLTFLVGAGVRTKLALVTEGGLNITTEDGKQIITD